METAQSYDHAEEDQISDDESSLYVDFENNGLLWIPPEPENDDNDYYGYDDDDDDDDDGNDEDDDHDDAKQVLTYSPSKHESISVLLSSRCQWKGTVCERSHLLRIKYYGSYDMPFGRFLSDRLFDQNYLCVSCEMPPEAHVESYTHRQGTIAISVKKLLDLILPGKKEGKIWIWHRCLRCPRAYYGFPPATTRIVMSDAAWGLSFGKFLELSFSNDAAASCGHSLHRDCLRFYGFGEMVACFRYASIDVYSVYLPPSKPDFNCKSQEWIVKELNEVVEKAEFLFSEVLKALSDDDLVKRQSGTHFSESRHRITDLEDVLQKEKSEFEKTVEKFLNKEANEGQPIIDILELNKLRRQLIVQSSTWDHLLIHAASRDVENQHDDTVCWLCIPFKSLFQSLNKHTVATVGTVSFQESEFQSGPRMLLPVGVNDIVIPVYHDEPSSIISYALVSTDYSDNEPVVSFVDDGPHGEVKFTVTCYYGKRFEDLRRMWCSSEADFVRSLSHCDKWGARGGESKTLDGRFIVNQATKAELESFIKFAPRYFEYVLESIGSEFPTCLAKMFGVYEVTSKHLKGGKETKIYVVVIENVLFRRNPSRLYDLKGSSRSRYNPDPSGSNKILLDQNLIEEMPTSPIFVGNEAKRLLERAIWNDTAFLASIDVMDYSLLVGVDEEKNELVFGIINIMRQYTWDKHLETWFTASGILGGPENISSTIVNPKDYKKRFRKAMSVYFLTIPPNQWYQDELSNENSHSSAEYDISRSFNLRV